MARKLTRKQILAGFGGPRRKAALTRSSRKPTTKKAPKMPARRTTRKKSPSRRTKRGFNIASAAVAANAVAQMVEPYLSAGLIGAVQSKDPQAVVAALKAGSKGAVTVANLIEAGGPALGLAVVRKLQKTVGFSSPRIGGIKAF